jgi:hypothetical protein
VKVEIVTNCLSCESLAMLRRYGTGKRYSVDRPIRRSILTDYLKEP